jgi:predicted homoserine dehydrogenase-like protein
MYLAQAKHTPESMSSALPNLAPDRARTSLERTGWGPERFAARSFAEALKSGATHITDDAEALIRGAEIENRGSMPPLIRRPASTNVQACCKHGKHIVMVNVGGRCARRPLACQTRTRMRASCTRWRMAISRR